MVGITTPPHRTAPPGPPAVILWVEDLFFSARLTDAVVLSRGNPMTTSDPEAFLQAMDTRLPVLALIDLHVPGDWAGTVRHCKLRPHTKAIPIIGFGRHTDVETLTRARRAGVDKAWARSRLVEALPHLLHQHISPPREMPAGGTDPLPSAAQTGIDLFNQRQFHAQHEALEHAWIAEPRPVRNLYQGLLQVGLAFLQIENRNQAGAVKMFGRGIPRLRHMPDVVQGVRVDRFLAEALAVFERLSAVDTPAAWAELAQNLPRIHQVPEQS